MKRECWGCNSTVEPERVDGLDRCPRCWNLGAFGAVGRKCAWLVIAAAVAVAVALAMLALYAVETPSPWTVLR